jgi:hypothetical protein
MYPRSKVAPWWASWSRGPPEPTGKGGFQVLCTSKAAGEMPVCHRKKPTFPVGSQYATARIISTQILQLKITIPQAGNNNLFQSWSFNNRLLRIVTRA